MPLSSSSTAERRCWSGPGTRGSRSLDERKQRRRSCLGRHDGLAHGETILYFLFLAFVAQRTLSCVIRDGDEQKKNTKNVNNTQLFSARDPHDRQTCAHGHNNANNPRPTMNDYWLRNWRDGEYRLWEKESERLASWQVNGTEINGYSAVGWAADVCGFTITTVSPSRGRQNYRKERLILSFDFRLSRTFCVETETAYIYILTTFWLVASGFRV